jgi:hypothetical protein
MMSRLGGMKGRSWIGGVCLHSGWPELRLKRSTSTAGLFSVRLHTDNGSDLPLNKTPIRPSSSKRPRLLALHWPDLGTRSFYVPNNQQAYTKGLLLIGYALVNTVSSLDHVCQDITGGSRVLYGETPKRKQPNHFELSRIRSRLHPYIMSHA